MFMLAASYHQRQNSARSGKVETSIQHVMVGWLHGWREGDRCDWPSRGGEWVGRVRERESERE